MHDGQRYNLRYVVGSQSFNQTLRKILGTRAGNLVQYTDRFVPRSVDSNEFDVLITDEAHRVRETSNTTRTPQHMRSDIPQMDELIRAARVPVFLLDVHQVVRPNETGTTEVITSSAERFGAEVISIDLDGHFRCGGSETYLRWVERLLGIEEGGALEWGGDENFELALARTPAEAEEWLRNKITKNCTARLTAGYCWRWSKPRRGKLVDDVTIENWKRPWNLKPRQKVPGVPPAPLWAWDPAGFNQVGCIYSAQGFEWEYAGVIIGPDLVWRTDHWCADSSNNYDDDHDGIKNAPEFDKLVRNVYRVLLTRGLKGCVVFSVDDETSAMLVHRGIPMLS